MATIEFIRTTTISFPKNASLQDITSGIEQGSMDVTETLLSSGINFGECDANKFEVTVYDCPDISGEYIYVYQTDGEDNEIPIFSGYVDSCKLDEFGYYRHIVAYDLMYARGNENIADWWGNFWDEQISSTLGIALRSMLDYLDIDYVDAVLINDNMPITQTQDISSMKFIDMLRAMCQLELVNANVNREGAIEFIDISDSTNTADITSQYEGGSSTFEAYTVQKISRVQIYDKLNALSGEAGTGTNVFIIQDNLFLYDKTQEDLQTLAELVYNKIKDITYKPANIKMIVSRDDVKLGMYVNTSKGLCLVCENEYSGSLLVEQRITSRGNEILAEAKPYDPMQARINAQVEEVVEEVEGAGMKYYKIQNNVAFVVRSEGEKVIISKRYITQKEGIVTFHAQVIFDVETVDDPDTIYDGIVSFEYTIGGEKVQSFVPEDIFTDGRHTMSLMYVWEPQANYTDTFKVTIKPQHCKITIGAFRIIGYLAGRGLVGDGYWDGSIDIEDEATVITIPTINVDEVIDTGATISMDEPITIIATDTAEVLSIPTITVVDNVGNEYVTNGDWLIDMLWGDVKLYNWGAIYDNYVWGTTI